MEHERRGKQGVREGMKWSRAGRGERESESGSMGKGKRVKEITRVLITQLSRKKYPSW